MREGNWTLCKISKSVDKDDEIMFGDDFKDIFKIEKCYKNGKENGKRISWYKNGQKKSEGTIIEDKWYKERGHREYKMDGKWTWWDEDGQIESESVYTEGECISGDC